MFKRAIKKAHFKLSSVIFLKISNRDNEHDDSATMKHSSASRPFCLFTFFIYLTICRSCRQNRKVWDMQSFFFFCCSIKYDVGKKTSTFQHRNLIVKNGDGAFISEHLCTPTPYTENKGFTYICSQLSVGWDHLFDQQTCCP